MSLFERLCPHWKAAAVLHGENRGLSENQQRKDKAKMDNVRVGQRVKVVAEGGHAYRVGSEYKVAQVDDADQTARLIDSRGRARDWIGWQLLAPSASIGWDFIKCHINAETVDFLSAFDGVENLALREEISQRVLLKVPALHDAILVALAEVGAEETEADAGRPRGRRILP